MRFWALFALCVAACGGGGGDDEPGLTAGQRAVVDCARRTIVDLARAGERIERVLAGDVPLTWVSGTTYSFDDGTMEGQATFPDDPAQGVPQGEEITIAFTLNGAPQGSGNVTLVFSDARTAAAGGGVNWSDPASGCSASLLLSSLQFRFAEAVAGPAPAAEVLGLELAGVLDATLTEPSGAQFEGDLEIAAPTQEALLDGTIDGDGFRHVFFAWPDAVQRAELAACLLELQALHAELFGILEQLTEAIDASGADLTTPPDVGGFEVTPVSPSNATYVIDAARLGTLFTAGTIRGSVRLTRVNLETTAFWSWRIEGDIGEDRAIGRSARFYEIAVGGAGTTRTDGEGTLGRGDCDGSFLDGETLTVRATVGPHELAVDYENGSPVAARIDGIGVPVDSIVP